MSSPSLSADAVQTQSTPAPAPAGTTTTTIAYDIAGRHLREKVVRTNQAFEDNPALRGTEVFQDNHLSYDTLGRLVSSADDSTLINFDYDKAGNRTRVRITSFVPGVNHPDSETPTYVSRYFLYDAMNRQTVVDGLNADGDISSAQGHKLTYDLNGNRRTDVFYGNHVTGTLTVYDHDNVSGGTIYHAGSLGHTTALVTESYAYDGLDRLQKTTRDGIEVDSRFYDEASRLLQSGPTGLPTDYGEEVNEGVAPEEQTGTEIRRMRYDVDGRLLFERVRKSDDSTGTYDVDYEGTSGHDHRQLGYDGVGNAIAYDTTIYDGGIDYLANVSLARFEGYVQKSETHTDLHGDQTGTTSSSYDANGLLVSLDDSTEDSLDRGFVNDADGHILRTRQGGNDLWSTVVSGEVLGRHGVGMDPADERTDHGAANLAQVSDFGFGYRHISGSYPKAGVGSYTIRQGDSLQSVAQAAFGDSKLWWKVAEANGVSGNTDLRVGQTLKLPNLVEGQSNDSGTFKPYDPSDAVGDTSPNLPMPHHGEACGGFGQVIMIVVAVAVTVWSEGVLSGYVAMGEVSASSVGAAAASAAAGSVAGQLVGDAIGAHQGLSFKEAALAAVSAGATQGVAPGLLSGDVRYTGASLAARVAAASALSQGIDLAVGLQDGFDYRSVAASAAGSQVGEAVSGALAPELNGIFDDPTAAKIVTGTAAGIASGSTVSLLRGGRVDVVQLAADAFGNALGSSVVDRMSSVGSTTDGAYQDGDIVRSELRLSAEPPPEPVDMAGLVGDEDWAIGVPSDLDRRGDILLAAGPGYAGLDVDPESVESLRGADGVYRVEIHGTSESPVLLGDGASFDDDAQRIEIVGKRMTDEEKATYDAQQFQETNDARVATGTYERFGEIGSAWSEGRYADVWRHVTFEASQHARAAAYERLFPQPDPALTRLAQMIASPTGASISGVANPMGASQLTQDRLLGTFGALEQLAGAGTGVYKQTLTGRSPVPSAAGAAPRSADPTTGPRYRFDATVDRYREVSSGQFVAARDLPWPPNAGFGSSTRQTVDVGTVLDRYGSLSGRFLGEAGATTSQRGMAPGSEDMPYTQLRVLKPFDAQVGPAAGVPAFGAAGGAQQYLPGRTVQQLVDQGFLEVIK